MEFGMLYGDGLTGGGDIEHVQDHLFVATVFAAMDGAHHFDDGFALMEGAFVAVSANDGQIALLYDSVVDYVVVMPAGFGSHGKHQPVYY